MILSEILDSTAVRVIGSTTSKKRLFQELGETLAPACGVRSTQITEALLERENLGPTGVGHGVALPHARLDSVNRVVGGFVRLERPLDFESVDRQPVDLVFVLLAPEDAGVEHLKALALVSRTMRNPALCSKLRANADPATLHTLLTDATAARAA